MLEYAIARAEGGVYLRLSPDPVRPTEKAMSVSSISNRPWLPAGVVGPRQGSFPQRPDCLDHALRTARHPRRDRFSLLAQVSSAGLYTHCLLPASSPYWLPKP